MYAICGATGSIDRAIAEKLIDDGHKVRVIGRSKDKMQPLTDKGVEPIAADLRDSDARRS